MLQKHSLWSLYKISQKQIGKSQPLACDDQNNTINYETRTARFDEEDARETAKKFLAKDNCTEWTLKKQKTDTDCGGQAPSIPALPAQHAPAMPVNPSAMKKWANYKCVKQVASTSAVNEQPTVADDCNTALQKLTDICSQLGWAAPVLNCCEQGVFPKQTFQWTVNVNEVQYTSPLHTVYSVKYVAKLAAIRAALEALGVLKGKQLAALPTLTHGIATTNTPICNVQRNNEQSIGAKLMMQMGWQRGGGLGAEGQGRAEPVTLDSRAPNCKRAIGAETLSKNKKKKKKKKGLSQVLKQFSVDWNNRKEQHNNNNINEYQPNHNFDSPFCEDQPNWNQSNNLNQYQYDDQTEEAYPNEGHFEPEEPHFRPEEEFNEYDCPLSTHMHNAAYPQETDDQEYNEAQNDDANYYPMQPDPNYRYSKPLNLEPVPNYRYSNPLNLEPDPNHRYSNPLNSQPDPEPDPEHLPYPHNTFEEIPKQTAKNQEQISAPVLPELSKPADTDTDNRLANVNSSIDDLFYSAASSHHQWPPDSPLKTPGRAVPLLVQSPLRLPDKGDVDMRAHSNCSAGSTHSHNDRATTPTQGLVYSAEVPVLKTTPNRRGLGGLDAYNYHEQLEIETLIRHQQTDNEAAVVSVLITDIQTEPEPEPATEGVTPTYSFEDDCPLPSALPRTQTDTKGTTEDTEPLQFRHMRDVLPNYSKHTNASQLLSDYCSRQRWKAPVFQSDTFIVDGKAVMKTMLLINNQLVFVNVTKLMKKKTAKFEAARAFAIAQGILDP